MILSHYLNVLSKLFECFLYLPSQLLTNSFKIFVLNTSLPINSRPKNKASALLLIAFSIVFSQFSCDSKLLKKGIEEGTIEYSISYPQIEKDSYLLDIMPNHMQMTFTNDIFRSDIVAGMGLFKTSIISNKNDEMLTHSLKLLNKKYASTMGNEDIIAVSPYYKDIEFEFTDETKKIAGFKCKKAIAHIKGDSSWSFDVYYTNQIAIANPNRLTPFESIKGVLMEYDLYNYNTHMRFMAQKVTEKEVDPALIDLEEDYVMISPTDLKSEIESIFAKVQ